MSATEEREEAPVTGDAHDRIETQWRVEQFLYREAALLDARDFMEWIELLAPTIDYRIPVRVTRERANADRAFSDRSFHMVEDHGSLQTRMNRFDTEHAWSENPSSRTRRFVSNVRVDDRPDGELHVTSNLAFHWSRGDAPAVVVSAERQDVLVRAGADELQLARRLVLVDHDSLPIPNLAVPL